MLGAQTSTASFAGRHEPLFADLGDALAEHACPHVLSFGCSAGWEPLDLARHLPRAAVLGCDVNEAVLREARARCPAEIEIFASTAEQLREHGPFDAITALTCCAATRRAMRWISRAAFRSRSSRAP